MKKIKSKKSLIAVVAVLLVVAFGVTYALFNTVNSFANNFDVGNYNVVTKETFTSPDNWLPGETIDKFITVVNEGDIPAAFRVKYDARWEDSEGNDITSQVPSDAVSLDYIFQNHWFYDEDDGYYYHKFIINPGETSCSFISGITLNEDLMGSASCEMVGDSYNCTSNLDGLAGAHYIITFTKETVAYDKYKAFWNTDLDITQEATISLPDGRTKDTLQVGDEICINGPTTECFNFVRYDEDEDIVMLSKWNLNVGSNAKETATNLQDSDVKGNVASGTKYGNVAFSGTNYWYDGSDLKPEYGTSYPADVYDTDYNDATGNNYSVAFYVENYKNLLESYGPMIKDARLLTYSEATDSSIGCNASNNSCPTTGFINNTGFWLGSTDDDNCVWVVRSDGVFYDDGFGNVNSYGVRPVIVISKSDI